MEEVAKDKSTRSQSHGGPDAATLEPLSCSRIVDELPHIVWSADVQGSIVHYNLRWFEFTGAERTTPAQSWAAWLHPDDLVLQLQQYAACVRNGQPYDAQCRLKHRSGLYRWVSIHARPNFDEHNQLLGWVGTFTDIHDQRKAAQRHH
jgi:PAS domain S-box-containing protein